MKLAQIEGGVVVNVVEVDPTAIPTVMADWPEVSESVGIGWTFDGEAFSEPVIDEAAALAAERAGMVCTPLQGKLVLGETAWGQIEDIVADPETPFAMRVAITSAVQWERNSQMIDELAWLMGLSDEQVDDLFRAAMQVAV
nr:hypothetical protein [uncultured Roseovarius sp.]